MKAFGIIGCDTSLSAFGIAQVRFDVERVGVLPPLVLDVRLEVLTSKPDTSGALSKGEDTSRRLRDYFRRLHALSLEADVDALAVEATAFMAGRSSFRTIHATARARQIVDDVGSALRMPVYEVTSSDVGKKAVDRPKGKSPKEERITSLCERYPLFAAALAGVKPSLAEHAADAFACVLVALPQALRQVGQ